MDAHNSGFRPGIWKRKEEEEEDMFDLVVNKCLMLLRLEFVDILFSVDQYLNGALHFTYASIDIHSFQFGFFYFLVCFLWLHVA